MSNVNFLRGTSGNLPSVGGGGSFYLCTDNTRLYYCNETGKSLKLIGENLDNLTVANSIKDNSSSIIGSKHLAFGNNLNVGVKGYYINNIDTYITEPVTGISGYQITVRFSDEANNTTGWSAGDIISLHCDYEWDACATILHADYGQICVDTLPQWILEGNYSTSSTKETLFTNHVIWNVTKPTIGDTDISTGIIAVGKDNAAYGSHSFVAGNKNIALGSNSFVVGTENEGAYASFVAGRGNKAVGKYCTAIGRSTVAGAINVDVAHAEGNNNQALAECAHAEGRNNTTSGIYSHAEGLNNIIFEEADAAHVEGDMNRVYAKYAHAEGENNNIYVGTQASHIEGGNNKIYGVGTYTLDDNTSITISSGNIANNQLYSISGGTYSHVEGIGNKVYNGASHAEGCNNIVTGVVAHAEGYGTKAKGVYCHTEGFETEARIDHSHAEGYKNIIYDGYSSHAEGRENKIHSGWASHVGGQGCINYGHRAFVHGLNNKSASVGTVEAQTIFGQHNKVTNSLFIIGNGAGDYSRTNAFEVTTRGTIILGSASFGTTVPTSLSEGELFFVTGA